MTTKTAGLIKITRTANAAINAEAAEANADWGREWGTEEVPFGAFAVSADCCRKRFYAVLPQDFEGAGLSCEHCGATINTGQTVGL